MDTFFFKKKKLKKKLKSNKEKMNVSDFDPDVRKQKTIALLFVSASVIVILCIVWMIDVGSFNTDVEETQCQLDNIPKDGCGEYKMSLEYETKVKDRKRSYALPIIILFILAGIVIGMLFLPGYPFSKFLNYKDCMELSKLYPTDNWNWSVSQNQKTDLLCKLFGACRCRSFVQEHNCVLYAVYNPQNTGIYYDYDYVQKKNSTKNLCLNRCGCVIGLNNYSAIQNNDGSYASVNCPGNSSSGICTNSNK